MENKYILVKKAYEINFSKIEEGYLACEQICYAETRGRAKTQLLDKIKYDDWKSNITGEPITYLNIPVRRCKIEDLYKFENCIYSLYQIEQILKERERIKELEDLFNNGNIGYCYIKKRGQYYCPNCCGYTDYIKYAGVYTKKEAIEEVKSCSELEVIPINVERHNSIINETINDLKTRLIKNK
jgi:hypothetical protein